MTHSKQALLESADMAPVQGSVEIDVPIEALWDCFSHPQWWSRWNRCMFWAHNRELAPGQQLIWAFEPLRWYYLYRLPGIAKLVEVEEKRRVTWEVTALPGFYARHTYFMEDLGGGRSRFGSWEQAMGSTFRLLKRLWLAHFGFVKDRSLQGARLLELIYRQQGRLDGQTLRWRSPFRPLREMLRSASLLPMKHIELAPGVYAVLNGGGNSLVLQDGGEVLLVDPKMPPFAGLLRRWIDRRWAAPVRTIVNTHFHYDHTFGNGLYPQARIFAHRTAPELMRQRDRAWWRGHPEGLPAAENLVDEGCTLQVGQQEIALHHSGRGHTASDLWLTLRRGPVEIVVAGDVASLSVYPFFDVGAGGADVLNMVRLLRHWAQTYPQAIFVPGHGPLARAADLQAHADYLAFLYDSVAAARAAGLSREEAVRQVDLAYFGLFNVPIFHYGWSFLSARSNVEAIYQLQERSAGLL